MPPAFLLFLCPILAEIDPQVIVLLVIGGISLLVKLFEKKKEEGTENTDSTTEAERRLKEKLESMAAKPKPQLLPTPTPKQRVAQQPRPRPAQQHHQSAPRPELRQTSATPQAAAAPWATKPQQPNSSTTADPFNFSINNATTSAQDSMTSLNQAELAALERIKHAKTASAPARGHAALLAANPSTHLTALHSPLSLRNAIITAEILGKPRGLQAL